MNVANSKMPDLKAFTLYDSVYLTFWKGQITEMENKSVFVCQGLGGNDTKEALTGNILGL